MFNEATRVARLTGGTTQSNFQRRKRTHFSGQFNENPPARGQDVNCRDPGKAQRDEAAENDESYEQEMKNKNGVCEESIAHRDKEICLAKLTVIKPIRSFR